jgi:hypothetical protein
MDLYCELNGFCILTLGFLHGYQNDPMIDIMIFRDSNKIKNLIFFFSISLRKS